MRLQQNMTHFNTVAPLLHQLDNVETELRLYNLRYFIGVLQIERHVCESRVQISASRKRHFAAVDSRSAVFRIHTRQRGKAGFALRNTIGKVAQTFLYVLYFFQRNFRLLSDYLYLYLGRNIRNTVLRKVFEVTAHLGRRYLDFTDQFLLHFLYFQTLTRIVTQGFTNLAGGLIEILLHFFAGTDVGDVHIRHIVHTLDNFSFGNFNTVECGLMQKQLLYGNFFRYHTVRVPVELTPFVQSAHTRLFHFGL